MMLVIEPDLGSFSYRRVKSHHTRLYENEPRSGSITSIIYHTCLHRSSTRSKRFTCSLLSSLTSLAEYLVKCYIKALREGEGKGSTEPAQQRPSLPAMAPSLFHETKTIGV